MSDLVHALALDAATPRPVVDSDATLVEIAVAMAAARVPMVAVVDRTVFLGVITVNDVVKHLLA